MTFEQFVKRNMSIPAVKSDLFESQIREYARYSRQEEMSRWKSEYLGKWTYHEEDQEDKQDIRWLKSNLYAGKQASYFYTDEVHLSDLDPKVFTASDNTKEAQISFDDAMGFGGVNGE